MAVLIEDSEQVDAHIPQGEHVLHLIVGGNEGSSTSRPALGR